MTVTYKKIKIVANAGFCQWVREQGWPNLQTAIQDLDSKKLLKFPRSTGNIKLYDFVTGNYGATGLIVIK